MILTWNRKVVTELPHPKTEERIEILKQCEPESMSAGLPVIWDKAKGHSVWDVFGNKFIDFTSTIFVTNSGHGAIANAIKKQADKLIHCYSYPNEPRIQLIERLRRFFPNNYKFYLASAGSEVTDWATKLMRHYGSTFKHKRNVIISYTGSFHGKVGDAAKLEGQELRLNLPKSSKDWSVHKKLIDRVKHHCCGIMIESYQGWSAEFMPIKYVQWLVTYCKKNKILVCFDEIQGGFWRTGNCFAYEHYESFFSSIQPDLICLGKALGGGMPISALAGRKDLFNVEHMSSTHSANPLCCAGAVEALNILSNSCSDINFTKKISILHKKIKHISDKFNIKVNGHGFLYGLIFKSKEIADEICYECMRNGLLVVRTGRESIKIGPPLTITKGALEEGLCVLEQAIKKCVEKTI